MRNSKDSGSTVAYTGGHMSANKKIAKNTVYLYIRMFVTMGISLYTSRLFLQILGIEDFGIYNLVGGVVVLFSFLNNAMSGATQRYLNIEVASSVPQTISRVFSMSVNVHVVVAGVVLILFETVGLWILNFKLNIPADRMFAANLVYQCSTVTAILEILKVPLNATVLVHERMSFYAVMSVLETLLRAGVIVSLPYLAIISDKLILYSCLLLSISLLSAAVLYLFCRKVFGSKVRYSFQKDGTLFRRFLSFSSWSLFGQVATLTTSQGLNFLLNNFFGVLINGALGVAGQLSGAIYNFVSNVQVAFNPQIVQSLARDDKSAHIKLVLQSSRFSFFILGLISVPFLAGTESVLMLWLGDVPEYAVGITKLVILSSLVSALASPFWMSIYALGDIKRYQLIISSLFLMQLPVFLFLLNLGYSPYLIMTAKLLMELGILLFRIYYFKTSLRVETTLMLDYLKRISPLFPVLISTLAFSRQIAKGDMVGIGIYTALAELAAITLVYRLGIGKAERTVVANFIKQKLVNA